MSVIQTWFSQDLQKAVKVNHLDGNLFSHNGNGNIIGVRVYNDGEPVTLAGTVSGYVITSDGSTVPCVGARSGNEATITIPPAAYQLGNAFITIFLTDGSTVTTLCAAQTTVLQARTGSQVSPGSVVQDWTQTINAAMQSVEDAAENLGGIIATPYASLTYPVPLGKYTYYNNNLYRCISPIDASEEFTAAHWTQVKLGDDVSELKSAVKNCKDFTSETNNNIYDITDEIINTPLEQGSLSATGDSEVDSDYFIRNKGYIKLIPGIYKFVCPSDKIFYLHRYNVDGSHINAPWWGVSGDRYRIETSDILIRIVIKNTDGSEITPESCKFDICRLATNLINKINAVDLNTDIKGESTQLIKVSDVLNLESGSIESDFVTPVSATKIRRARLFSFPQDFVLYILDGAYEVGYTTFGENYSAVWSGWTHAGSIRFEKGKLYSALFTKMNTSSDYVLTLDEIDQAFVFTVNSFPHMNRYHPIIQGISHQGNTIIDSSNHDKVEGYINAAKCGFTIAETDLKYTSDGVLVCCHDNTFVDATSGETISIPATRYSDLIQHNFYGGVISTFEEILTACRMNGLKLQVDQIGNTTYANALINILDKCRAWDDVMLIVGAGNIDVANALLSANDFCEIVVISSTATVEEMVDFAKTIDNNKAKITIAISTNQFSFDPATTLGLPSKYKVNIWTIDDKATILRYAPYLNYYTTNIYPWSELN